VERRSSLTRGRGRGDDGARSSPRRIATRRDEGGRLDGSLQLFASDIDDRGGGGDAIKSERARRCGRRKRNLPLNSAAA